MNNFIMGLMMVVDGWNSSVLMNDHGFHQGLMGLMTGSRMVVNNHDNR